MTIPTPVLFFLTDERFVKPMAGLSVGLGVAVLAAPRLLRPARESAVAARMSPFWLLVPTVAGIALEFLLDQKIGSTVSLGILVAIVVVQMGVTGVLIYRHRRWPWLVAPFALVPWLWWAIGIAAVAMSGMGG